MALGDRHPPTHHHDGNALAKSALRRAHAREESRLHTRRRARAGARHRREHGDLQRGQRGAAAAVTLPGLGPALLHLRNPPAVRRDVGFLSELSRLARRPAQLRRPFLLPSSGPQPHRRRRARAAARRDGDGELFQSDVRLAQTWTGVHRKRRQVRRTERRRAQRGALARALRRRPPCAGPFADPQRDRLRSHRRHARRTHESARGRALRSHRLVRRPGVLEDAGKSSRHLRDGAFEKRRPRSRRRTPTSPSSAKISKRFIPQRIRRTA